MNNITTEHTVEFFMDDYDPPLVASFTSRDPEHVKQIVSALSAYFSGDPCRCKINGDDAVLENDWGLMENRS